MYASIISFRHSKELEFMIYEQKPYQVVRLHWPDTILVFWEVLRIKNSRFRVKDAYKKPCTLQTTLSPMAYLMIYTAVNECINVVSKKRHRASTWTCVSQRQTTTHRKTLTHHPLPTLAARHTDSQKHRNTYSIRKLQHERQKQQRQKTKREKLKGERRDVNHEISFTNIQTTTYINNHSHKLITNSPRKT